jgi:peptide methionine sulfoxide reductase MsrA
MIRCALVLASATAASGALMARPPLSSGMSRRGMLKQAAAAAAVPLIGATPMIAHAADDEAVEVYFGCGCFWHVQHEFVEAEKKILGRSDDQLTSLTGYAGGSLGMRDGKVCYHNAAFQSDYGSLGHAEVVGMKIPRSKFKEFAAEYCRLFDAKGRRPDQDGDRGTEYRNLVGLPGGTKSPLAKELVAASLAEGDKLDFGVGKGDDADAKALAWVYDTKEFPFYQAEPYHQFHDGFAWGEDYPNSYNNLQKRLFKAKVVKDTGCPNGAIGLGFAGL